MTEETLINEYVQGYKKKALHMIMNEKPKQNKNEQMMK